MTVNGARFTKRVRLLKPAEYSRVFKKAIRSSDRLLTVLAASNDLGHPRIGLVISRKNAKRAVDRNRIKRVIRESFRLRQLELPAADFVIMAKPVTKSADNLELFKSLEHHWNRLIKQCAKSSSQ
ncbi:MAG: ribonuclease P protein component [Gammaproteobacteria bacterium]|nr:ribonuclease P protein component [Gammaproteobacteria bacterium]